MGFKTIFKLQSYLTRQNLELLDEVLRGLTEPSEKISFDSFWGWFGKLPGMTQGGVEHAVRSLKGLRKILRDYMDGRG